MIERACFPPKYSETLEFSECGEVYVQAILWAARSLLTPYKNWTKLNSAINIDADPVSPIVPEAVAWDSYGAIQRVVYDALVAWNVADCDHPRYRFRVSRPAYSVLLAVMNEDPQVEQFDRFKGWGTTRTEHSFLLRCFDAAIMSEKKLVSVHQDPGS